MSPRARSRSANPTARSAKKLLQAHGPDAGLVLAVLEDGAEGGVGGGRVELVAPERRNCSRPVDRLGDTGWLVDAPVADARCGGRDLPRQPLGHTRRAQANDLDLALDR